MPPTARPLLTYEARQRTRHLDAGADHVCVQVLTDQAVLPRPQWRELASALLPGR